MARDKETFDQEEEMMRNFSQSGYDNFGNYSQGSEGLYPQKNDTMYNPHEYGYNPIDRSGDFVPEAEAETHQGRTMQHAGRPNKNIYGGPYGPGYHGAPKHNREMRENQEIQYDQYPGYGEFNPSFVCAAKKPQREGSGRSEYGPGGPGSNTPNTYNIPLKAAEHPLEKVGFFKRILNLLVMLAGLGVLLAGIYGLVAEHIPSLDLIHEVTIGGVLTILDSVLISLALQVFAAVIWLLCFRKAGKIESILFILLIAAYLLVGFVFQNRFKSQNLVDILLFGIGSGMAVTIGAISLSEQYVKGTRGWTVFFLLLFLSVNTLQFVVDMEYLRLPAALPSDVALTVLHILSAVLYGLSFMLVNTFWKKRTVKTYVPKLKKNKA